MSVDGWASTHQAWLALFPLVVLLRCFLHGWLNIRSRGKLSESFRESVEAGLGVVSRAVPPGLRATAAAAPRVGPTAEMSAWLLEQVEKLCGRSKEYAEAYSHPGGHRTSNMLDRMMRGMNRYFDRGQHLHGSPAACRLHCRAWALLANLRPLAPGRRARQRGMAMPRRTPQPPSLPRRLAPEPARSPPPSAATASTPPKSVTVRKDQQPCRSHGRLLNLDPVEIGASHIIRRPWVCRTTEATRRL